MYAFEPETKQQSPLWVFQNESNLTKAIEALRNATVFEERRTVNLKDICLPQTLSEKRKTNKRPVSHSSSRQYQLSHISSNNQLSTHTMEMVHFSSNITLR